MCVGKQTLRRREKSRGGKLDGLQPFRRTNAPPGVLDRDLVCPACRWPWESARRRSRELPAGGQENCPLVAMSSAHASDGSAPRVVAVVGPFPVR